MSTAGEREDGGRDEIVAGEYVLGVLDAEARRAAEQRIASDPAFAALVGRWESDLSRFNAEYGEVTPPAPVLARIEERLFASDATARQASTGGLWNSLAFWRGLAVASLVGVAVLAALEADIYGPGRNAGAPLVAELSVRDRALSARKKRSNTRS